MTRIGRGARRPQGERRSNRGLWGRSGVAAVLVAASTAFGAPDPAIAQGGWVNPDVFALREEVSRLSREVAALRGEGVQGGGAGLDPGAPAATGDVYVRLERLDQAVRNLTGAVEELDRYTREAGRRTDAKLAELDFRMARLEGGASGPYEGGPIPGAEALTEQPGAGRLQPLQPENLTGRGEPASVLGVLRDDQNQQVEAGPIYDNPRTGGGAPPPQTGGQAPTALVASAPVRYEDALKSIQAGDHTAAENQLQAFIAQNEGDPRVGVATYWLGETYRVRGRFRDAAQTYAAGLRKHPTSQRAPDSWMRLGMSLAQLNQVSKACEAFAQVEARFPDAPSRVLRETKTQSRRAGCQ